MQRSTGYVNPGLLEGRLAVQSAPITVLDTAGIIAGSTLLCARLEAIRLSDRRHALVLFWATALGPEPQRISISPVNLFAPCDSARFAYRIVPDRPRRSKQA